MEGVIKELDLGTCPISSNPPPFSAPQPKIYNIFFSFFMNILLEPVTWGDTTEKKGFTLFSGILLRLKVNNKKGQIYLFNR